MQFLRQRFASGSRLKRRYKSINMTGYIDEFTMGTFEEFVASTKISQKLAPEALLAFEKFLETLNFFFDSIEDIGSENFDTKSKVTWYKMVQAASGEYVRVKSKHYNGPAFDNVAINMTQDGNEEPMFFTDKGACFGKVCN